MKRLQRNETWADLGVRLRGVAVCGVCEGLEEGLAEKRLAVAHRRRAAAEGDRHALVGAVTPPLTREPQCPQRH